MGRLAPASPPSKPEDGESCPTAIRNRFAAVPCAGTAPDDVPVSWKIPHENTNMMRNEVTKTIETEDFPLPCLITRGYGSQWKVEDISTP